MSTYVLVHGSLMGGWCWHDVSDYLRAAGHEVFTPTLTGLGERAHLANAEVGLYTHIQDVVGVLECEELYDVVLVGYSYAGMVITGVAERVPERLKRLVYLDAYVPEDGQSTDDILGPEIAQKNQELAKEKGDGWRLPLSVNPPPRWQPQPLKTTTEALEIKNPATEKILRAYIHCTIRTADSPMAAYMQSLDQAAQMAKEKGWWYRDIEANHGVVFSSPKELSNLLLELA